MRCQAWALLKISGLLMLSSSDMAVYSVTGGFRLEMVRMVGIDKLHQSCACNNPKVSYEASLVQILELGSIGPVWQAPFSNRILGGVCWLVDHPLALARHYQWSLAGLGSCSGTY